MRLNLFVFALLCLLVSCKKGPTQAEYDSLKSKYENSNKELKNIKNTPRKRLITAKRYEANNELENAEKEYKTIIKLYPKSEEAGIAQDFLIKREKQLLALKIEKERLANLDFKNINENNTISKNHLILNFTEITIEDRWIFDRYDSRYVSRNTKRGSKYITTTLSIQSDINEPLLPIILAYKLEEGELKLIGPLKYEFYRWKSYGAYLGNYTDKSNDFAHTETVTFSLGLLIEEKIAKTTPIFLLADKINCAYRSYDRLNSPNTSYLHNKCEIRKTLNIAEATTLYNTVKIFNKEKI